MGGTPERPNAWNSYWLWKKDSEAKTEAKANMVPTSPKRFQTCSMPTSPVENTMTRLYSHWDLFTVLSGSHDTDYTAGVGKELNMKTIDPSTLLQENEPSSPSTNSELATFYTRPAITEEINDREPLPPLSHFQSKDS